MRRATRWPVAVFFNRLGEIRDRSFEQQRYRASGLNLVTAAIVLWNTVYPERATQGVGRGRQAGGRRAAAIPVAAGLGAHQPNRRLRLAAEPQTGRQGSFGPYGCPENLSVRFFPNSAGSPIGKKCPNFFWVIGIFCCRTHLCFRS